MATRRNVFPILQAAKSSDAPPSRIERMFVAMNVRGQAIGPVTSRGTRSRVDPFQAWAVVSAARLLRHEEGLVVFIATGDRKALAAAWHAARDEARALRDARNWKVKKHDLVDALALTAVYDVCNPEAFANYSGRKWAREFGIEKREWPTRWRDRYNLVRAIVQTWLDDAVEKLERQLFTNRK